MFGVGTESIPAERSRPLPLRTPRSARPSSSAGGTSTAPREARKGRGEAEEKEGRGMKKR